MSKSKLTDSDYTIVNDKQNIIYIKFLNKKGKQNELVRRQKIFLSNILQLDKYTGRTDRSAVILIEKYKRINKTLYDEISKIRTCATNDKENVEDCPDFVAYEIKYPERIDIIVEDLQKFYDVEKAIRVDTEEGMERAIDSLLRINEDMVIDIILSRIEMMPTTKITNYLKGTVNCIGFNLVEKEKEVA